MLLNNPLLRYELSQVFHRRGAFVRLLVFSGIVALGIFAVWPREAKFLNMRDKISRDTFNNIAFALQALVLLFAPAYAATSVTPDREEGMLEMLSSSAFLPRQMIQGKVLASAAYVWMLIASTIPLSAIVFTMGGIGGGEFIAIYLELFLISLLISAYGVRCSVLAQRSSEALAQAYFHVLPLGALWILFRDLHPLWLLAPLFLIPSILRNPLLVHVLKYPFDYPLKDRREKQDAVEERLGHWLRRAVALPRRNRVMRQWENPVVVRELRYQELGSAGQALRLLPGVLIASILLAIAFVGFTGMSILFHLGVLLLLGFFIPALGAPSFASEIHQRTFEALLLTPMRRSSIVGAKLWVPVRTGFILLLIIETIGLIISVIFNPLSLALVLQGMMLTAAAIVLVASISVFCSLIARSTAQAVIVSYAVVFAIFLGIPALWRHLYIYNDVAPRNYAWMGGLSPLMPFLVLQHGIAWLEAVGKSYGSALGASDVYTAHFIFFALAVSCVLFACTTVILNKFWRKFACVI